MGGKTSVESITAWKGRNYRQFNLCLRYDTDQKLIDYIEARAAEGTGVTEVIREALNAYLATL